MVSFVGMLDSLHRDNRRLVLPRLYGTTSAVIQLILTAGFLPRCLNYRNLFRREVVEFIDQVVDLTVECGALVFG